MQIDEAIGRLLPIVDNDAYTDQFRDACKVAVDALKKQVQKDSDFESTYYVDGVKVYDYICPRCREFHEREQEPHMFCPSCGQAIDWSDK